MFRVNTFRACLVLFGGVAAVLSALAQTSDQLPVSTNAPEPTPTPQTSPLLTPQTVLPTPPPLPALSPYPTPLPDGSMPLALPPMPAPASMPTPLPDGTILIPGVLDSTTNFVEHPELVAERIVRYAELVGRENVIAGTDCGFSTFARAQLTVHPSVTWAKFQAMAAGAELASNQLWG